VTLVSCSEQTASPSSRPTPAPTSVPTPTPLLSSNCTASLVVGQVDNLLAGKDFETHYLTIGDKFTLSV